MLEENWRVRLEELSFGSHERRGVTRAGSRVSLYRVRFDAVSYPCRLRGTVAERRSLAGELSLSHARLAADG